MKRKRTIQHKLFHYKTPLNLFKPIRFNNDAITFTKHRINGLLGNIGIFTNSPKNPSKKIMSRYKNSSYPFLQKRLSLNPFSDIDNDGVPNIFDCRPFNRKKQDVRPNKLQMKRINRLPIYVTREAVSYDNPNKKQKFYHIKDKDAPREIKQRVYSVIKKYPQTISNIEKRKPAFVLFTEAGISEGGKQSSYYGYASRRTMVIRTKDIKKQGLEGTREVAQTTGHELKHVSQYTQLQKKPKKFRKLFRGSYESQPGEISARKEEEKVKYSRKDINIKLMQRKLAEDRRKKYIEHEGEIYNKEDVKQQIKDIKKEEEERAESGVRSITKNV